MSEGQNRNDNLQDYLDLLEEYGNIEETAEVEQESTVQTKDDSNVNSEKGNFSVKPDFFEDYEVEDEEATYGKSYEEKKYSTPDLPRSANDKPKKITVFDKISAWYNGLPKGKKIGVSIIAVILALIITLSAVLGIFITSKFNKMGDNLDGYSDDIIYEDEEFDDISGQIGSSNFNQALKDWATTGNGSHMSSKNVINVLLIGADSRKGTNTGNTDVMMVISVNKKTKQLKLVSFLRDSYLYVDGKKSSHCTKLNAAFSMGGPETLIQTIENNYKISIDNYVMVNFQSFKEIIDAMGGITVDVKQYEADYNYKHFKVRLPAGENVTLNGRQALCFVRIRGCDPDGDVSRTRRQRQVINAMLDRVMNSSIGELNKYVDVLMPYVDTGYSQGQILSLGLKALAGGWAKYERSQIQMPPEDCRTSGSANGWVWVVDYQKAANLLQTELYGSSNIVLEEGRTTIIDVYKGAHYQSSTPSNDKKDDNKENNVIVVETYGPTDVPETTESINNDVTEEVTENNGIPETTEGVTEPVTEVEETTEATTQAQITTTTTTTTTTKPTQETPTEAAE